MIVGNELFCDTNTIQEAITLLEQKDESIEEILYILAGTYHEQVKIYRSNLTLVGLGNVEISAGKYAKQTDDSGNEIGTFMTPTIFINGSNITIKNITILNNAGPGEKVGQAIALSAYGDELYFENCSFKGHQDTLFVGPYPPRQKDGTPFKGITIAKQYKTYRQYYQKCYIEGTIDFIFGSATAYFSQCEIRSLQQTNQNQGFITAASTPENQKHGLIFNKCLLTAEAGTKDVYLGRPWRAYAQTAFIDCYMGQHIAPCKWHDWENAGNQKTVRYSEYHTNEETGAFIQKNAWFSQEQRDIAEYQLEVIFPSTNFYKKK